MSADPTQARWRRTPQMAWQRVDGELVLLNVDGHELIGVNTVGARVWDLIDGQRTVEGVIDTIAAEYAIDRAAASHDVLEYLAALANAGAISLG